MAKTDKVSKIDPLRTRREEEKEERRQAILDAAEKVIARDGWEATNFGEIAKRARLSRSLVYFYFPARDDLFHALCGRGLTDMERRFAKAFASERVGLDQVMAIGRAYYEFSVAEPLYFMMIADYQARDLDPDNKSANEAEAHRAWSQLPQARWWRRHSARDSPTAASANRSATPVHGDLRLGIHPWAHPDRVAQGGDAQGGLWPHRGEGDGARLWSPARLVGGALKIVT